MADSARQPHGAVTVLDSPPPDPQRPAAAQLVRRPVLPAQRGPRDRIVRRGPAHPRASSSWDPSSWDPSSWDTELRELLCRIAAQRYGAEPDPGDIDPLLVDMLRRTLGRPWRVGANGDIDPSGIAMGPIGVPPALERPRQVVRSHSVRPRPRPWALAIEGPGPVRSWWWPWVKGRTPWQVRAGLAAAIGVSATGLIVAFAQPGPPAPAVQAQAAAPPPATGYLLPTDLPPTVYYQLPPAGAPFAVDPALLGPGAFGPLPTYPAPVAGVDTSGLDLGGLDAGAVDGSGTGGTPGGTGTGGLGGTGGTDTGGPGSGVVNPGGGSEGNVDTTTPPTTRPPSMPPSTKPSTPPPTTPPSTTPTTPPSPSGTVSFPPLLAYLFGEFGPVDAAGSDAEGLPLAPSDATHLGVWEGSTDTRTVVVIGAEHAAAKELVNTERTAGDSELLLFRAADAAIPGSVPSLTRFTVGPTRSLLPADLPGFLTPPPAATDPAAPPAPVVLLLRTAEGNVLVAEATPTP